MGWSARPKNRRTILKKLLICSPSHAVRGGVETIISDLCSELPKRGWEATVALGKGSRFNNVAAYRNAYPDLLTVEIDGTRGTRQARVEALKQVITAVRPQIVLSARIFDAYEAVANLKLKHKSPRLAVAVRAYEPPYVYDARLYRSCIDLCVADGKLITAALVNLCGIPPGRVANVPSGVCAPKVRPEPRRPRSPFRLGYVGRLETSQKRVSDIPKFLEALDRRSVDWSLDILGSGPAENELKTQLAAFHDSGRVRFRGWQSRDSLNEVYFPTIDCLIHFAHTEGVTIAPREAMTHGIVPVISQFTGLHSEGLFVDELNALTFPVGDTNQAALCVDRLRSEAGLMERLSTNASQSQSGDYSLSGSMERWAEALDRCLDAPPTLSAAPQVTATDGRLARKYISPWLAQRLRNVLGRSFLHSDPGSEWPQSSGLMDAASAEEISRFALEYEASLFAVAPGHAPHHESPAVSDLTL